MEEIIRSYLTPILKESLDDEIVNYVKSMQTIDDLHEFLESIIDVNNEEHLNVQQQLKSALFGNSENGNTSTTQQSPQKTDNNPLKENDTQTSPSKLDGRGKKQKFINIDLHPSTSLLKKGRHPCNCEARIHPLISNCLSCGKIVCEQEGSGPCFFCSNMVCTQEEQEILDSNTKGSSKLYNRLMEQKTSKEWKKAIESRDRLLQRDMDHSKNVIYDEDKDYYKIEREEKDRKSMKYILDLTERMIITEPDEFTKNIDELMKGVNKLFDLPEPRFPHIFPIDETTYDEDQITPYEFLDDMEDEEYEKIMNPCDFIGVSDRFLENVDKGLCLSLHQPWASLLIAGIKRHEGRTWYTPHKGKLWIHAAAQQPDPNDISQVEEMYRKLYNDPEMVFPKKYPTGCLMGRVYVDDCLTQDEYRKKYPDGESDSPYVYICSEPQILPIFFTMPGQHKIFQLNREMHLRVKDLITLIKH